MLAAGLDPAAQAGGIGATAYYGALPIAALALIHSLDRTASSALEALRPDLDMDEAEIAVAHHELTVAPARPAWLIALFSVVITTLGYVSDPVGSGIAGYSARGAGVPLVLGEPDHGDLPRAHLPHRAPASADRPNPRAGPRGSTSSTRRGCMRCPGSRRGRRSGSSSCWRQACSCCRRPPGSRTGSSRWAWYASAVAIATAAFFLPLWGMHGRLVAEKRPAAGRGRGAAQAAARAAQRRHRHRRSRACRRAQQDDRQHRSSSARSLRSCQPGHGPRAPCEAS